MRKVSTLLGVVLLAACGPAEEEEPAGLTLTDVAGTWQNVAMLNGVENPVSSTMTGTASGSNWTMTLEGRPNIPMQVSIVGDSLIAITDEYESVLRDGVMVTVRTASVLQNGELVGNLVATYRTEDGTEEVTGTMRGTRTSN